MTLTCVIALILRFLPNSIVLQAKYVTVVEYRPIMPLHVVSQLQSCTFGHNQPTLQRGLSAIAELLVRFTSHCNLLAER